MSLLGNARRLAEAEILTDSDRCLMCGGSIHEMVIHTPSCPWRALPSIVAALEAAKRLSAIVIAEQHHHREDVRPMGDGVGTYSWCPTCDSAWPCRWSDALTANAVFVAALKGEEVTA